jgi:hypothetical protein
MYCPRCNKPLVPAISMNGSPSISFLDCPNCGTLVNTFRPTTYQASYLRRKERYKMAAGGFGSGKSRVNIEDVIKHLLLIKGARVCVAARTYPVLSGTFVKEFKSIFPDKLIKSSNEQKHEYLLTNGSELMFRSFDDPNKLKSLNLSMVVIVEASDVPHTGFTMMQSRLRNTAACLPLLDANGVPVVRWDEKSQSYKIVWRVDVRHISLETNPDSGWVKSDFLLSAQTVEFFGDAYNEGYRFKEMKDKNKYVQVVSTNANPHLPEGYIEEQTDGKSEAYVMQYFRSSFNFSSNLVLPHFGVVVVPPHPLPPAFDEYGKRTLYYAIAVDYGVSDPTHFIYTAYSTITKKLYVYDELRLNNSDVIVLSEAHRKQYKANGTDLNGLFMRPLFDGRSYNKRESNLKTIGENFEEQGLFFTPSFSFMEPRIIKLNSLINHGQIEIYSTCEFLVEEGLNYKWKLDRFGKATKVPQDKNDHGIVALMLIAVELPSNLHSLNLKAFLPPGTKIEHDKRVVVEKKPYVYNPLEVKNERNVSTIIPIIDPVESMDYIHSTNIHDEEETGGTLGAYTPRT